MRLNKANQARAVSKIRRLMHQYYGNSLQGPDAGPIEHWCWCLFWAFFTVKVLRREYGIPAQLQAGTAYWPLLSPEKDDGKSPTRYGYEFSFDKAAIDRKSGGPGSR